MNKRILIAQYSDKFSKGIVASTLLTGNSSSETHRRHHRADSCGMNDPKLVF